MWRSLQGRNITNQGREFTGMEHYKSCLGIYRDGTLPIMSRNLQGWNITNQGREFTGMELCSVCNGRRTHCFTSGYFRQTGVTDRLMEVYKFRRALTEITGMELNICITMRKKSFEALTQIVAY